MADNFKKDYAEYINQIKPDSKFLSSLQETLEQEEKKHKANKRIRLMSKICGAAACVVIGAGVFTVIGINLRTPDITDSKQSGTSVGENISNHGASANISAIDTVPINNIGWLTEELKEQPVAKALAQRLKSSLKELKKSDSNSFVDSQILAQQDREELISRLERAAETETASAGTAEYYMAVFDDMTVAKFSVWENGVIVINGSEKFFS